MSESILIHKGKEVPLRKYGLTDVAYFDTFEQALELGKDVQSDWYEIRHNIFTGWKVTFKGLKL